MINPATYNIVAPQGATFDTTFTFEIDGDPVDLTGYDAEMMIRATPPSDYVLSLTDGDGITLGGAAGTIVVLISATDTAGIEAGSYLYDLKLTSAGVVTRLLQGTFLLTPEITHG
jgi:hypothetical protein